MFSSLTTLQVGGPAREYRELTIEELPDLVTRSAPLLVVGEGSNLLVSDAGFDGLVVRLKSDAITVLETTPDSVRVRAEAGVRWDALVERCVAEGWAGVECLSGIPGYVGAAPIQNIGAYGQEVAETVESVETIEHTTGARRVFTAAECGFGYRQSHFKGDWKGRYLVTAVIFRLSKQATSVPRYRDLTHRLGEGPCTLSVLRDTVLQVRREKSMVLDPADPNTRSAGSFFMNPIVDESLVPEGAPNYPGGAEGKRKLSAAWLIEQSGFPKGYRRGRAALSQRHVLALTNLGGASSQDMIDLAREVRAGVRERFGVTLWPEPEFIGFSASVAELLGD